MDPTITTSAQEMPLEKKGPQERSSLHWLQTWLTCVAYYYPAYWLSQFLIHSLPSLIQVVLFRERLRFLQLTPFIALAISGPVSNLSPAQNQASNSRALLEVVLIAIAAAILLGVLSQTHRLHAGLTLALLGQIGMVTWLWPGFRRTAISSQSIIVSAFFLGLMILGLRWMLIAHVNLRFPARVGSLLADFVFPPALAGIVGIVLHNPWLSRQTFRLLVPGVLASMFVSLLPQPALASEPRRTGWRSVAAGLATTLVFLVAVFWGDRFVTNAFERTRLAANQAAMASFPETPANLPYPKLFFQKGVNFTAEFPEVYASEGARRMLELLPQYGVNAIALVPYGWSSTHPPRVLLPRQGQSWESDEGIEELSRVAHALGMKVLLRPSVWKAYDLDIPLAADRETWFDEYQGFLEDYARLAKASHADLFCVGGELVHLTPYDSDWRRVISRIRELYPGPLVYAANFGQEFEHVAFWDALDYIGLQEYYPLPDNLAVDPIVQKVEVVQQQYHRPVIFTEVGFPSLEGANRQPWDDSLPGKISVQAQAAAYQAVFRAFYNQPWFEGMYWWKIETNGNGGLQDSSHTPWGKPAMDVMKRWYIEGGRR